MKFFCFIYAWMYLLSYGNLCFANEDLDQHRLGIREHMMHDVSTTWATPTSHNASLDLGESNEFKYKVLGKLKSLVVPKICFSEMPLSRVIEVLSELSSELDSEGVGINMVLIDPGMINPLVSINLRQVSLEKVLSFISKCTQFSYDIQQDTILFEYSPGSSLTLDTGFFPISRATVIRLTDIQKQDKSGGSKGCVLSTLEEEDALRIFFQKAGIDFENTPGSSFAFEGTQLIVTHTPRNLERVRSILDHYPQVKQVQIQAKFLEVQEGVLEEIGFKWSAEKRDQYLHTGQNGVDNLRSVSQAFATQGTSGGDGLVVVNNNKVSIPNSPPVLPNALNLGTKSVPIGNIVGVLDGWNLSAMVRALEQHSGSDLMSAPKLTVLSGKTAQIVVAQEFRYPESFGDIGSEVGSNNLNGGGGAGVSITAGTPKNFTVRNIGVEMEVTPTVESNNNISLRLEPKVTEFEGFIEYGGSSIALTGSTSVNVPSKFFQPIFSTRRLSTELTIGNGETAVMGGLSREEVRTVKDKVPLLGDIPGLGRLFQSKGQTSQKRSLLIFVTAHLISPSGQIDSNSH